MMDDETEPTKLFVGQIPRELREEDVKQYFDEFGPISEVSIIRDNNTMVSKGCAFVTYLYPQSAMSAIDCLHNQFKLPNAVNPLQVRLAETQVERENKLFIGMLPKTVNEQDLFNMFHIYGELREVHIIRGHEGTSKGCAFVKFVDREAAYAAIEDLHDTIPMGATRPLVVKFADTKKAANEQQYYQQPQIPMAGNRAPYNTYDANMNQQSMYPYPAQLPHQQMLGVPYMPYGAPGSPHPIHSPVMSPMSPQGHPIFMNAASQNPFFPSSPGGAHMPQPPHTTQVLSYGMPMNPPIQQQPPALDPRSGYIAPAQDLYQFRGAPNRIGESMSHQRPPEGPSGANLFIYHLPRDLTDADLATLFAPFGNVISAKVFVDKKTADSKGFGFVSYDTLISADAAIESMNGFQIGSKRLKVQHKRVAGAAPMHHQQMPLHHNSLPHNNPYIPGSPYNAPGSLSRAVDLYYGEPNRVIPPNNYDLQQPYQPELYLSQIETKAPLLQSRSHSTEHIDSIIDTNIIDKVDFIDPQFYHNDTLRASILPTDGSQYDNTESNNNSNNNPTLTNNNNNSNNTTTNNNNSEIIRESLLPSDGSIQYNNTISIVDNNINHTNSNDN